MAHTLRKLICENLSPFELLVIQYQYINDLFVEQEIKPCEVYPLITVTMLFFHYCYETIDDD